MGEFTHIDLSIGCGGTAVGLENAGFKMFFGITDDEVSLKTVSKNRKEWDVVYGEIEKLSFKAYRDDSIDIVTASIPFSMYNVHSLKTVGEENAEKIKRAEQRAEEKKKNKYHRIATKIENDKVENIIRDIKARNAEEPHGDAQVTGQSKYIHAIFRAIREIKPKFFMIDAVPSLMKHDGGDTIEYLKDYVVEMGYTFDVHNINAVDYGIAQKRKRLIIIGMNTALYMSQKKIGNVFVFPKPVKPSQRKVLRDVIHGIIEHPQKRAGMEYSAEKKKIMALVPPGGCWVDLPLAVQKKYCNNVTQAGGNRGIARRMAWDEACLTLTTSPNQKKTDRCHPDETRPFTVLEYALIQSFPETWEFTGSIANRYRQIGNSLPPLLVTKIGEKIKRFLSYEDLSDIYESSDDEMGAVPAPITPQRGVSSRKKNVVQKRESSEGDNSNRSNRSLASKLSPGIGAKIAVSKKQNNSFDDDSDELTNEDSDKLSNEDSDKLSNEDSDESSTND